MRLRVVLLAALLASPAFADDSIPKPFQGTWNLSKQDCHQPGDGEVTVDASSVTTVGSGCELKRVTKSNSSTFAGSFECDGEGEVFTDDIELKLARGKLVLRGNLPLVRCN
jgi:hypothetical protein